MGSLVCVLFDWLVLVDELVELVEMLVLEEVEVVVVWLVDVELVEAEVEVLEVEAEVLVD